MTVFVTPPPQGHTRIPVETAIEIALTLSDGHRRPFASTRVAVKLVLMAIRQAGWEIVPKGKGQGHESPARTERADSVNDLWSK